MNFNNDGDKILTGAFDGTAIVLFYINFRYGTLEQESPFIFYKVIQDKYQALNSSLVATFVVHHQLIKPADFGMLVQENVYPFFADIMTKF